jgi:hypothetical protein
VHDAVGVVVCKAIQGKALIEKRGGTREGLEKEGGPLTGKVGRSAIDRTGGLAP